jgi:hypothetical protein
MVYNSIFEPIRTTAAVFDHVAEHKQFESLYSTRHFGPLVFHLCLTHQLDEFLVYSILKDDLQSAANAVRVFLKVHTGRIYFEKILVELQTVPVFISVLRIRYVYPGSEFFYPDPVSSVKKIPDSGSTSKNLSTQKIVFKLSEI